MFFGFCDTAYFVFYAIGHVVHFIDIHADYAVLLVKSGGYVVVNSYQMLFQLLELVGLLLLCVLLAENSVTLGGKGQTHTLPSSFMTLAIRYSPLPHRTK